MQKILLLLLTLFMFACNSTPTTSILEDKAAWDKFVTNLTEKATPAGGYGNINYREKSGGLEFVVDISTDTNGLSWDRYTYSNGAFIPKEKLTLEVSDGAKPTDFVYKSYQYDLKKVTKLVDDAKSKMEGVKQTRAILFAVNTPNFSDGDFAKEFNTVIWIKDLDSKIIHTFRYNAADSCEMQAQLPADYKF